ncbi:MAG: hypothetical protein AB2595_19900 [Candidatus Thiodiazotropha endolucinida]
MAPSTLSRLRLGGLSVGLLLILLLVSLHLMSSAVQNSADLSRYFVPLLPVVSPGSTSLRTASTEA